MSRLSCLLYTSALGYGLEEVKGEELTKAKETNVINSLSGKVAGLVVQNTAGGASGSTRVLLRGNTEMAGNNQPLYVEMCIRDRYNTWFKPIVFESYKPSTKTLLVQVPSPFVYEYLEQNYVGSVSYTHLDVYKRQLSYIGMGVLTIITIALMVINRQRIVKEERKVKK